MDDVRQERRAVSDGHAEYWREAVMNAFEGCDCWDAIKDIPMAKLAEIGESLATSAEHQSLAFHTPESPLIGENRRLSTKLKWERERHSCDACNGTGRIEYTAGPWGVNTSCHVCHGDGKVHPRREPEPA